MDKNIPDNTLNWKLKEVIDSISIVHEDASVFKSIILRKLHLPMPTGWANSTIEITDIDWDKMPYHYKFYYDRLGWEEKIKHAFEVSILSKTKHLIITYGWQQPAVMIPTEIFIDDWEGFVHSTHYECLIFSEDYKLIMEVARNYYLHSNFKIME